MPVNRFMPGCCCGQISTPGCCNGQNYGTYVSFYDPLGPNLFYWTPYEPRTFRLVRNASGCNGGWGVTTTDAFVNYWRAFICFYPSAQGCLLTLRYTTINVGVPTDVYEYIGYSATTVCNPLSITWNVPAYTGTTWAFSSRTVTLTDQAG